MDETTKNIFETSWKFKCKEGRRIQRPKRFDKDNKNEKTGSKETLEYSNGIGSQKI